MSRDHDHDDSDRDDADERDDGARDDQDRGERDHRDDRDHRDEGERGVGRPAPAASRDWFSRLILWLAAIVAGLALVVIAAAYLPGWWAQRVADVVAGNRTAGVLGGLAVGAVFAAFPLLLLRAAARRASTWRVRLTRAVLAVLLAVPDLLTFAVMTSGGHDGLVARAVLDARGQGFRGGSLTGAAVGVVAVIAGWVLLAGRRRRLHELHDLRTQLQLRDATAAGTADPGDVHDPDRRDPD